MTATTATVAPSGRRGMSGAIADRPVWVRLTGLVGSGLLALGTCVGVMLVQNGRAASAAEELADVHRASALVLQLDRNAADLKVAALGAVLRGDPAQAKDAVDRELTTTTTLLGGLRAVRLPAQQHASVERISTAFTEYAAVVRRFAEGAAADPAAARAAWVQVDVDNYLTSAVTRNEREYFAGTIDRATAAASADQRTATRSVLLTVVIATLVLTLLARVVVRSITLPLGRVQRALDAVADGDLTVTSGVTSRDELGRMARALDHALERLRGTITSVARSADEMATSSGELNSVAGELTTTAASAAGQAQQVSTSARGMSGSAQAITSATGQMISAISEISMQALSASAVAAEAVQTVAETSRAVEALDSASQEIGEIIQTITSIAEQTNLLALNATIEAARAGAAGAGFAVVASEVKELARGTASATEDITVKISAIQETTEAAIRSIGQISAVIRQINEKQTTIASAVEEQTSVTQLMSGSVAEISQGAAQVTSTIDDITGGTLATTRAATTTAESAARLAQLSAETRSALSRFRY